MSKDADPNLERIEAGLKAHNLLAQGKRNMICQEYNTAVNQYQEACELLVKCFGEMGKELAEPYFRYGSALLELARAESGVFGTAIPGMDDDDDDDEDEAESSEEQGEKTSDENEDGESATTKENSADESASQEGSPSAEEQDKKEEEKTDGEKKEDEKMEGETKKEAGKTDDAQAGCSKDDNGKEEEEEDESNLKLAWEVLELAKIIFLRSETKEDQLKAAECYIKLGEIGLESDTIDGAIQDFKSSLEIQCKHVEPHNRILAETHYQLGMAYGMAGDMENSAESYKQAAKTITAKIEVLEKLTEGAAADKGKAPAAMDDPIANAQDELKELKELLPDIVAKVEEAEAEAKSSREAARRFAAAAFGLENNAQGNNPFASFAGFGSSSSAAASGSSSSSQPQASSTSEASSASVSNITHLVRKKRKQEGEDGDCGVEVKRTRSENGTGEAACEGSQGQQQEQGSGDSATTTDKQTTPAPVAAVSGESA